MSFVWANIDYYHGVTRSTRHCTGSS